MRQFVGSIRRIARNPYIDRFAAVGRHLDWQRRKLLREFPQELVLSESVLVATHGRCGVSALVNAHGLYDYNNMTLLKRVLAHGGVFVDVGANVGAYTLVASEQPRASILAYEPHPRTFALLEENLRRNNRRNVSAICAAVGARVGTLSISDTPGSSTTHVTSSEDAATIKVPVVRLDIELERRALSADAIKIDVEGFEYDDLRGAGGESIFSLLRDAGFEGPYFYDAGAGVCRRTTVHGGEDPVFVNRSRVESGLTALDCSLLALPD